MNNTEKTQKRHRKDAEKTQKRRRKDAELSNEYWRLQQLNASPEMELGILKKCPPIRRKRACYLCLYQMNLSPNADIKTSSS